MVVDWAAMAPDTFEVVVASDVRGTAATGQRLVGAQIMESTHAQQPRWRATWVWLGHSGSALGQTGSPPSSQVQVSEWTQGQPLAETAYS